MYVLNPALQDGKKIPKWDPRACLGLFLGFSDLHSSQVPMVLNVTTGWISPQFHVIFDDKFDTVHSLPVDQPLTEQWNQILRLGHDSFTDLDYGEDGEPILPTLLDVTRSYSEQRQRRNDLQVFQPCMLPGDSNEALGDIDDVEGATENMNGVSVEEISAPKGVPCGVSAEEIIAPEGAPPQYPPVPEGVMKEIDASNGRPRRNVGTY